MMMMMMTMPRGQQQRQGNIRDVGVGVKSKRLRTVEHRQVGDERANLLDLLDSRNLVSDVELELVVEDGVREPDLDDDGQERVHL